MTERTEAQADSDHRHRAVYCGNSRVQALEGHSDRQKSPSPKIGYCFS